MVYMMISPYTGQKVIGFRQTRENQVISRDIGRGSIKTRLTGDVGDRFNYITLENYGKGEVYPVPIKNKLRQ